MADCEYVREVCRLGLFALIFSASQAVFGQNVSGYLEYQGRREAREEGGDVTGNQGTLRVDADTPLWKPWLAQFSTGLGLTYYETTRDDMSQTGTQITGGARLRLLPRSIFPFEAFVDRYDSDVDGELIGPSYEQTRYGFVQTYTPSVGALYRLRYEHSDRSDEGRFVGAGESNTEEDRMTFEINRAFKNQSLNFSSDYDRIERDVPETTNTRGVNVVRHQYSPGSTFSINTLLSDVRTEFEQQTNYNRTGQTQFTSNAFWRPETAKPLLVTGSVLASGFDSQSNGPRTENTLMTGSATASYQIKPALSWRTSASLSENRSNTTERLTSLARTGLTYSPASIPLKKWFYAYSLSGDVGSRTDTAAEDTQEASASLSHTLNRSRNLRGGTGGVSLSQQLFVVQDTADRREQGMNNSATADWSSRAGRKSIYLRALASDNRRIDGTDIGFQLINFQANGSVQATRLSSWAGNATLQWTRNRDDVSTTPWLNSGSVNVVYRRERVFRIPLLRFSSELRLLTEDLALAREDEFSKNRRETAAWINRLDYLIGRTQITLRGQVSQVDGRRYQLLYLQVRRYFGRFAQ